MKTKKLEIYGLFLAALFMASSAKAATYEFNFLSNNFTYDVAGFLTTSNVLNAVSGYDISSITGAVFGTGGGLITSLVSNPNQPFPYNNGSFQYDNVLFPTSVPHLDINGVLFTTANGTTWNLWGTSPTSYTLATAGNAVYETGTFILGAPVPEPSTWAMMLGGLGLIGFMSYRRREYL